MRPTEAPVVARTAAGEQIPARREQGQLLDEIVRPPRQGVRHDQCCAVGETDAVRSGELPDHGAGSRAGVSRHACPQNGSDLHVRTAKGERANGADAQFVPGELACRGRADEHVGPARLLQGFQ